MKGHQRHGNGGGPDNDGHEWQESNRHNDEDPADEYQQKPILFASPLCHTFTRGEKGLK